MIVKDRGWGNYRPAGMPSIKWGHPIAQGLVCAFICNEDGGGVTDLVTGNTIPFVNSGSYVTTPFGYGLNSNGFDMGASMIAWSLLKTPTKAVTIVWRGTIQANPDKAAKIFCVTTATAGTYPYVCYGIQTHPSNTNSFDGQCYDGISALEMEGISPVAWNGTERHVTAVFDPATAKSRMYEGTQVTGERNFSIAISGAYSANSKVSFGCQYNSGEHLNTKTVHKLVYVFARALNGGEVAQLATEPFCIISRKVSYGGAIFSTPITQTVSDSMNTLADATINSGYSKQALGFFDAFSFLDGITVSGGGPFFTLNFGDKINLSDAVRLPLGNLIKTFSDSINNLADSIAKSIGIPVQAFDSQQFNWADLITTQFLGPFTRTASDSINNLADSASVVAGNVLLSVLVSDNINHLLDAQRIFIILKLAMGDNFVLSDSTTARFINLLRLQDTALNLLDSAVLSNMVKPRFGDSFNLTDTAVIQLAANNRVSVGDIFSLNDSAAISLSGNFTPATVVDRIRRYLNDTN